MLEEELIQLVEIAQLNRAVASNTLASGMQLAVYPLDDGVIVVVGFGPEQAHFVRMEDVLRKRGQNLERFGAWHPCLYNDGGCYVARRVLNSGAEQEDAMPGDEDLRLAEELLT